jgi:multidrug efflux pump subunit AcrA (membrane-fusion protein)
MRLRLLVGLVACCGLVWILGCQKRRQSSVASGVAVRVMTAKKEVLQRPIIVFGQTEAYQRSNLAFQVAGVVAKVRVEEGDPIKVGASLASLDKESIKLNLRLSRARYYEAAASYRKLKGGYRKELVKQYYSAYKRAKATYQKAQVDYRSAVALKKSGAISKEQLTRARSTFATARASMNQAYQAYQMYLHGYQKEDIQVAGVKTSQARTQLALAKKQLRDTELRAPFSGVVAQKNVGVGELVSAQRTAFVLMDLSKIRIRVGVPERVIQHLSLGQTALVMLEGRKLLARGKLARKGVVLDKTTLSYPVEIEVDNPVVRYEEKKPIRKVLPGKVVVVAFPRQRPKKGIAVPLGAVLHDGAQKYLFLNQKGFAKKVVISTGDTHGNRIVITKGLRGGEQVIVAGQHRLDRGRRLFVVGGGQ